MDDDDEAFLEAVAALLQLSRKSFSLESACFYSPTPVEQKFSEACSPQKRPSTTKSLPPRLRRCRALPRRVSQASS